MADNRSHLSYKFEIGFKTYWKVKVKSVIMSQEAHLNAGALPSFCSMKRLGVFLLLPGWDASTCTMQGYP